mgnify:CR=1 FL=1
MTMQITPTPAPQTMSVIDRFVAITTDDVQVRVDGDTAVILGRVTVKMRTGTEGQYRYTTVWLKRRDRWRLVAEQHTRIEAPPR